ncbi:hypothetical protein ACFVR6_05920 [Microbacterium sp. NPDC058021]|uniref:hypothetical protein n=1 Tax=Microbacterium sp. NPDC058021 TaxID=3346306 RepID=UPI0036DE3CD2
MKRKLQASVLAFIILFGGGMLSAQAAHAEDVGTMPSGCSISSGTPYASGAYVKWTGSGYCNATNINNFVARLVHNYDGLPDVRVATVYSSPANRPNYSATGTTCDGGGTTQYYNESGYYRSAANGGDVIRTSSQVTLTHC